MNSALQEAEVVALPRIIVKRWPGAGIDILVREVAVHCLCIRTTVIAPGKGTVQKSLWVQRAIVCRSTMLAWGGTTQRSSTAKPRPGWK